MKRSKPVSLRELRQQAGKTLEEVAAATGLPYSTVRALEIGLGDRFSAAIKHTLSSYYGRNFFEVFPEEREKLRPILREAPQSPHHLLLTLYDFAEGLRFDQAGEAAAITILKAMTMDELEELYHSGMSREEAIDTLNKYATKYGLPPAKALASRSKR